MKILHRLIGRTEKPLVIAEIGINHNGDIDTAKAMVKLRVTLAVNALHQTHF